MVTVGAVTSTLILLSLICTSLALPIARNSEATSLDSEQERVTGSNHPYLATVLKYTRLEKEWPLFRAKEYVPAYFSQPQRSAQSTRSSNVSGSTLRLDTSNLRGPWDKVLELYRDYVIKEPKMVRRGYEEVVYHGRPQGKWQQIKDLWSSVRFKKLKVTKQQYRQTVAKYRPSAGDAPTRAAAPSVPRRQPIYKRWWQRFVSWRSQATESNRRPSAARYARQFTRFF